MAQIILEDATLAEDVELKFGKNSGKSYCRFRVAENRREQRDGEWVDAATAFHTVIVYGRLAENVAESLAKGQRVHVVGDQRAREYTPDGATRAVTVLEIHADFVAPSLTFGSTTFTRNSTAAAVEEVPAVPDEDAPPAEDSEPAKSRSKK